MKKKLLNTQDWSIKIRHRDTQEEIVICNYVSATSKKACIPFNYPYGEKPDTKWINAEEVINDYKFIKSWTPDDVVDHVNSFRERVL